MNEKCRHCRKVRGQHNAMTKACPHGLKTRVGYCTYHPTNRFEPTLKKRLRVIGGESPRQPQSGAK